MSQTFEHLRLRRPRCKIQGRFTGKGKRVFGIKLYVNPTLEMGQKTWSPQSVAHEKEQPERQEENPDGKRSLI